MTMQSKSISNKQIRIIFDETAAYCEKIIIHADPQDQTQTNFNWIPVLCSFPYVTLPTDLRYAADFALDPTQVHVEVKGNQASIRLDHPDHRIDRVISLSATSDTIDFTVTFQAKKNLVLRALEDRWNFLPERREQDDPLTGPLDFVWSQRIKSFPTSFIPHYSFRTPIVMMQQGAVFAGIIPGLETVDAESLAQAPLGLDLDVTRERYPWMSFGAIAGTAMTPDHPCEAGHSQLLRQVDDPAGRMILQAGDTITYRYTILAACQPARLGYRHALRYLWHRYGEPAMARGWKKPQNKRYPGVEMLKQWEEEIWEKKAAAEYFEVEKAGKTVGGLIGNRQGEWFSRTDYKHDVWFACWLQELISGYGMLLHGQTTGNPQWIDRAEHILNYILSAPRAGGLFPIICYYEADGRETWLKDDGWAGFRQEYHALQMSWTAWLMLLWGQHLFPGRREEVLAFCRPYADHLVSQQHVDGCIPAWYDDQGHPARVQFRDFNAETATSALFLLEIGTMEQNDSYQAAGRRALDFITEQVLPRQRWFDLETFLSCARKPFDFYDSISTQYPQCNLSQMHAALAYLKSYQITQKPEDLQQAENVLDYLLLTQQLWQHPFLQINAFGGFTVQNTDNEWSDVREGLCGFILYQYFLATGKREYLERSVAAVKSGFEVLPYENWAHCGYEGMQYDSSLLWGGGVILTAATYLADQMGHLVVHAEGSYGLGLDGCHVHQVTVKEDQIYIEAEFSTQLQSQPIFMRVFAAGRKSYTIRINDRLMGTFTGEQLEGKISLGVF